MNIFLLDTLPAQCAIYHVDRHVVKMILETAQLLSTACHLNDMPVRMQPTHRNHPSAVWARSTAGNWLWLRQLGIELCKEYTYRYEKIHACQDYIKTLPCPLKDGELNLLGMPQCMPDEYKNPDPVQAYRNYYAYGKRELHAWKKRRMPEWLEERLQ